MNASLVCISFLALLIVVLATNVVVSRIITRTLFGYTQSPDDLLYKAIRAHTNAIEYIPIGALLIYILGQSEPSFLKLVIMSGFAISRLLAALGILFSQALDKFSLMRFLGTSGSILTLLMLVSMTIMQSIGSSVFIES